MSAAQAYYEIFKSLPKKTRMELLELIQGETSKGLKKEIIEGLKEIKAIREGKQKPVELKDFLAELKSGS